MTATPLSEDARIVIERIDGKLNAFLREEGKERKLGESGLGVQEEIDFIWLIQSAASFHRVLCIGHKSVIDGRGHLRHEIKVV
jgi:hypothetical protein